MITFSFNGKSYQTERVIGNITGSEDGPVVVLTGGLHGNERSGVIALQKVFEELSENQTQLQGRLLGLAGNLPALVENKRFISADLNRIWEGDVSSYQQNEPNFKGKVEHHERYELFQIIQPLMEADNPLFFVDLHTTSSHSVPFIAINDQIDNRNFALQFPVPTVLGIEEYLAGPLLSYLNDFGHVALAFEAGQHDDPDSIEIHISFIYLAMISAGIIEQNQVPRFNEHRTRLENCGRSNRGFFEVIFRKAIVTDDGFKMNPGYNNFTSIKKGELLARDDDGPIRAIHPGKIFMPLYQPDGTDGFFIVRKVPQWALKLSKVLRRINFERILTFLPGVSRCREHPDAIIVNKGIARFLSVEIFHLLGYRRKKTTGKTTTFVRREVVKH